MNPVEETYRLIKKYDIHARKRFGQNFLTDSHVLEKITRASGVGEGDFVLEIGPGLGTLTRALCEKVSGTWDASDVGAEDPSPQKEARGHVLAVEIDYDLVDILEKEVMPLYPQLEVIEGDILKTDITEISKKYNNGKPIKIVANLPYYITTPIIMELLEGDAPVESITVMVQKEVADRMMAAPGDRDCGAVSLAVAYRAVPYLAANVPQNCFKPRPNVSSAVIRLDILDEPLVHTEDEKLMFKLIRAAFSQRRKTLVNAIAGSAELDISKDAALLAIQKVGLSPTVRGEKLDLKAYAKLADALRKS